MKSLIYIVLFLLEYVLSKNLEKDVGRGHALDLLKLNVLNKQLQDSGTYYSSNTELQGIKPEEISLFVYTQADTKGAQIYLSNASVITEISPFNIKIKTVFYVHGWGDTVEDEGSEMIKNALLENANVNVIIVDWDTCATSIDYFVSQRCVADVGRYIGQFIETVSQEYIYSLSDITVVGHSLGAHIGGHVGKYSNGSLGVIVGLDPAGPFYFKGIRSARLTEDDAQYVQAIHTDAIFLGVNFNVGHADFWPNGGFTQNGCGLNAECSHQNAYKYYAESVIKNDFFAKQCDSFDHFEEGTCKENFKSLMGGVNVNTSAFGNFYLDTNTKSPFGKGDMI